MEITYARINNPSLRGDITKAQYKHVYMELEISDDLVFIWGMESSNPGNGECQEMIALLKEDFKGKRFGSSPPVREASKHILDKMGVNYMDYMK